MADPGEKLTVEEVVELNKLLVAIGDQLDAADKEQAARWTLVKDVVHAACFAVLTMRQDLNDEKKDEGPPFWLSVLLTIALTAIPVSAISAAFFEVLALSVQRRLARAESTIKQIRFPKTPFYRRKAVQARRIATEEAEKLKRTEEMVAKFSELYEPEVANTLQDKAKDLIEWGTKPLYQPEQPAAGKGEQKPAGKEKGELKRAEDVPLVAIENAMHDWIASWVRVEAAAEKRLKEKLRALFDLATTTDKKNFREKIKTYRSLLSQEERPKDRDEAKAKIKAAYKQYVEESIEEGVLPKKLQRNDLFDVQLMIECLIWCATFDFSPQNVVVTQPILEASVPYGAPIFRTYDLGRLAPPPFPPSFWEVLIKRYIDPDSYLDPSQPPKTFKEAGTKSGQSPELRLALYFGHTLINQLTSENNAAIRRLEAVKASKTPGFVEILRGMPPKL
jgi:hypothetical protein